MAAARKSARLGAKIAAPAAAAGAATPEDFVLVGDDDSASRSSFLFRAAALHVAPPHDDGADDGGEVSVNFAVEAKGTKKKGAARQKKKKEAEPVVFVVESAEEEEEEEEEDLDQDQDDRPLDQLHEYGDDDESAEDGEEEQEEEDVDLAGQLADALGGAPAAVRGTRAGPHAGSARAHLNRRTQRRAEAAGDQIAAYRENKTKRVAVTTMAAAAAAAAATDSGSPGPGCKAPKTPSARKGAAKKAKEHRGGLELAENETISTRDYWFGQPAPLERTVTTCVAQAPTAAPVAGESCCICMEEFLSVDPEVQQQYAGQRVVQLAKCAARHPFHSGCIKQALTATPRCPICMVPVAAACGTQPDGVMTLQRAAMRLSGETCDTVIVSYHFPSGTQGPRHPTPSRPYHGTGRTAYFPYSAQGRVVLQQLMRAWDSRVLFTVGTSVTTGASDCVVWNGVHHKTSPSGGTAHYGYPDATYLTRVSEEMASVGVF